MSGCSDTKIPDPPKPPRTPTWCQVDSGWDECESLQYTQKHATFDVLGQAGLGNRVVIQLPN